MEYILIVVGIILLMRNSKPVIPTGDTILMENDLLYLRK